MKKICFDSEPNPLRVDKSGLHRKKSTFRLFLTAASYSPLQKTPKKTKNVSNRKHANFTVRIVVG